MTTTRNILLGMAVMALIGIAPARAEDSPYPPVAAVEGVCPDQYVYGDRYDHCVSRIGEYDGELYRCNKGHHPQFQVFPDAERPQRCCRKNWPPEDPNDGRGKGLCHRWHPKPYDVTGGQG